MDTKHLDETVEQILHTRSVSRAQKIMESQSGIWLVAFVSFIESAFPIPILTDPFMIAAIVLNRTKTATIIFVTTVASVLGGIVAFFTVVFFLDMLERFVSTGITSSLESLSAKYSDSTLLVSILGAVTPVPYTSAAWAVALIGGNLVVFVIASFFGRGFRYLIVGLLTYKFGPAAVKYARRYIGIVSIIIFLLAILYVWHKM